MTLRTFELITLFSFLCVGLACGESNGDDPPEDAGVDATPGMDAAPDGAEDAGQDPPDPLFAVFGAVFSAEGSSAYVTLVDSLGPEVTLTGDDLGDALTFAGTPTIGIDPGQPSTFFVGLTEEPTVQRWRVTEDEEFMLDGEVSFMREGLASAAAGRNPLIFISPTKAYYVDGNSLLVIVWNPTEMTVTGTFSFDGIAEADLLARTNFINRDGDRLIISARHFREDMSAEILGTVAIIDTTDDSVTYDRQTRCGNLAWSSQNTAGDIYFASHPAQAASRVAGTAGDPAGEPCIVRMLSGSDGFDPDYLVDLEELTGAPSGALIQGPGDTAFVLRYNEEIFPLTMESALRGTVLPAWEYYRVEMGNEAATLEPVVGVDPGAAFGLSFIAEVGVPPEPRPFVVSVAGDLASGRFLDASGTEFVAGITLPGFPGAAFRVR